MSALPGSPQAPSAPVAAVAAPPSISDIIGSPPPAIDVPGLSPQTGPTAPAETVPAEANAAPSPVSQLAGAFGVTGDTPEAQAAALRPVLEMMAQHQPAGANPHLQQSYRQPQQSPQNSQGFQPQSPQQQTTQQQQEVTPLDFSDIDLGDASPEVAAAIKQIGQRSQAAISAAQKQANEVQQALYLQQHQQHAAQQQQQLAAKAEVTQRAVGYLDSLASPKYGVGQQRTMVQTIAAEQVMATAGKLISGMEAYGKVLPIDQVMAAAVLMVDGQVPTPAAAAPAAPVVAPLGQTPAPAGAIQAPRQRVGSAGAGQALMGDAEFLDGARAILAR